MRPLGRRPGIHNPDSWLWIPASRGRRAPRNDVKLSLPRAHQILDVELSREHRQGAVGIARPFLLRAIAIELDAVLVGIAQIQRLADAVIAGAVELNTGGKHAMQRIG